MKKNKFKYIAAFFLAIGLGSCDFLDTDESTDYTKEDVYQSMDRNKRSVTHIYGFLPHDFMGTGGGMHDSATDNAVHIYDDDNIQRFVNGTWSPNYVIDDVWDKYYSAIRAANMYLMESENETFEEWEYTDGYESFMKDFNNYQYEVRFLRAFYYFELIKRYGNIPFTLDVLSVDEANKIKSTSGDKIAEFIIKECTEVSKELPIDYKSFSNQETGRITKGAALALKSRVALYMASPLFNKNNDKSKWVEAVKASYELIAISGKLGYELTKYPSLFNAGNHKNKEVILARPTGESGDFERANFPAGIEGGRTSTCPTQNLMEAYEMRDGTPFLWEDVKVNTDPYANRDPRMKFTIACNNMKWPTNNLLEVWEGGANGLPLQNASKTGYYLKKYVNNEISFESGSKVTKKHHNWILFRYAEILLNYAEAMVNAFDDPYYKNNDFSLSAVEAVNQVRARTGINMPALPENLSTEEFKTRLANERRVEFAFEGHRFWDLRRNLQLADSSDIYGVKVKKTEEGFKYTKFLYEKRDFGDKMYLYPISNNELFKNDCLKQNPGWN